MLNFIFIFFFILNLTKEQERELNQSQELTKAYYLMLKTTFSDNEAFKKAKLFLTFYQEEEQQINDSYYDKITQLQAQKSKKIQEVNEVFLQELSKVKLKETKNQDLLLEEQHKKEKKKNHLQTKIFQLQQEQETQEKNQEELTELKKLYLELQHQLSQLEIPSSLVLSLQKDLNSLQNEQQLLELNHQQKLQAINQENLDLQVKSLLHKERKEVETKIQGKINHLYFYKQKLKLTDKEFFLYFTNEREIKELNLKKKKKIKKFFDLKISKKLTKDEIEQYFKLIENGFITQEELEAAKKEAAKKHDFFLEPYFSDEEIIQIIQAKTSEEKEKLFTLFWKKQIDEIKEEQENQEREKLQQEEKANKQQEKLKKLEQHLLFQKKCNSFFREKKTTLLTFKQKYQQLQQEAQTLCFDTFLLDRTYFQIINNPQLFFLQEEIEKQQVKRKKEELSNQQAIMIQKKIRRYLISKKYKNIQAFIFLQKMHKYIDENYQKKEENKLISQKRKNNNKQVIIFLCLMLTSSFLSFYKPKKKEKNYEQANRHSK